MKKVSQQKTIKIYRDAGTGRFLTKAQFKRRLKNTVVQETNVLGKKQRNS